MLSLMVSFAYSPVCSINVAEDVTYVQKTETGKVLKENRRLELYSFQALHKLCICK